MPQHPSQEVFAPAHGNDVAIRKNGVGEGLPGPDLTTSLPSAPVSIKPSVSAGGDEPRLCNGLAAFP
jgi:hypothetical protein